MHAQTNPHGDGAYWELDFYVQPPGQLLIRPEISRSFVSMLKQDSSSASPHRTTIDHLIGEVQAGNVIDLQAARSPEAAEHDGMEPTTAGYILGLIRDTFEGYGADWRQVVALGALAAEIEAAVA